LVILGIQLHGQNVQNTTYTIHIHPALQIFCVFLVILEHLVKLNKNGDNLGSIFGGFHRLLVYSYMRPKKSPPKICELHHLIRN
jgi:hypothetical protein